VSNRYVFAVVVLPLVVPDVPVEDVPPVPEVTFVRRNFVLASPVVPDVPVVPVVV
jgi:hypothetical protein